MESNKEETFDNYDWNDITDDENMREPFTIVDPGGHKPTKEEKKNERFLDYVSVTPHLYLNTESGYVYLNVILLSATACLISLLLELLSLTKAGILFFVIAATLTFIVNIKIPYPKTKFTRFRLTSLFILFTTADTILLGKFFLYLIETFMLSNTTMTSDIFKIPSFVIAFIFSFIFNRDE